MRTLALTALLLLPAGVTAQQARTFAVRCGTLHVGDGTVLHDAVLTVVDGQIQAVGSGPGAPSIPEDMRVIDASDKVVMPGIVAADTNLSGHGDAPYTITPDFIALDGVDLTRPRPRLLSGGVTTTYLSPGRNRLISGQGSVIKAHGDDLVRRVLIETACLRLNMGDEATKAPAVFEPNAAPTADDPLVPARKQFPSSRISLVPELRRLFEDATAMDAEDGSNGDMHGEGAPEDHYAILALQQAARGVLPLRIAAKRAADVRRALAFARGIGARVVLEDPWEIKRVAADAARQGASAVFRIPVRPGASNPGGENRLSTGPKSRPANAARAVAAGMKVAIAPASDAGMVDYLMVAGLAIRHGLSAEQAMRAITVDAAAILGVDDRVGTLDVGKDADLLVLSGPAFAIGTMVEKTWIGGDLVYERANASSMLAVRCGKIQTMAGDTFRDGVILVSNGKIKAVGEDLAIPYGARVIDARGGVMVPGFVDAYCHAGLSGEGSGVPNGAADQRIADVVRRDDPVLRAAAEAGLTTVLVSGKDSGTVSGRVAAIKTGALPSASLVLKETAAIRFVHDAIGPNSIKPLADAIGRGRRYSDAWKKYEKALADFNSGKTDKKPEAAKPPEEKPAAADPISGTWNLEFVEAPPIPVEMSLTLKLAGTTVTGSLTMQMRGNQMPPIEIEGGKFEDGKLSGTVRLMGDESTVTATVGEDTMSGVIDGRMTIEFSATRTTRGGDEATPTPTAKPSGDTKPAASKESEAPKEPNVDENLEPLRALVEGRIPAVVRADRGPAITAVAKWFTEQKLALVMTGVRDAIDTPEVFGETPPPVLLGPDVVRRKRGETINAAALLSDRGMPVALGTGDTAGARYLPLHAALAVRYGMDPTEALKALTIHAARMFKIDDRVGSLERGKDADFVVFSGNPFEMTSRVRLVVVGGEVVVDARDDDEGAAGK